MRFRALGAAVAAVLAVAGLAGCRTNVGTAAWVNGHRITESDVNDYVRAGGPDAAFVAQVQQSGQSTPSPRGFVLHFLIQQRVFEGTLASLGEVPSAGKLASYHDPAAGTFTQLGSTGAAFDKAITRNFTKAGMTAGFTSVFLRTIELEYAIVHTKQLTKFRQLAALVKQVHIDVSVSPRYGTWQPNHLALTGHPVVPSYLSVQPSQGNAVANQGSS